MRSSTARINSSFGIASKQLAMSVSTTHRLPRQDSSMSTCRASCAERLEPVTGIEPACPAWESHSSTRISRFRAAGWARYCPYCPLDADSCGPLVVRLGGRLVHTPPTQGGSTVLVMPLGGQLPRAPLPGQGRRRVTELPIFSCVMSAVGRLAGGWMREKRPDGALSPRPAARRAARSARRQ